MEKFDLKRKYSIRKYSVGVVSVLAATTFLVSGHDAKAAEQHDSEAPLTQQVNAPSEMPPDVTQEEAGTPTAQTTTPQPHTEAQEVDEQAVQHPSKISDHANDVSGVTPSTTEVSAQSYEQPATPPTTENTPQSVTAPKSENEPDTAQVAPTDSTPATAPQTAHQSKTPDNVAEANDNASLAPTTSKHDETKTTEESGQNIATQDKPETATSELESVTSEDVTSKENTQPSANETASTSEQAQDTPSTDANKDKDLTEPEVKEDSTPSTDEKSEVSTSKAQPASKAVVVEQPEKAPQTRAPQPASTTNQPVAKAAQAQHVNQYPIVLVHGFLGLVDKNAPELYPNYWGGDKYPVIEDLKNKGYDIYQASVGAFSSNYDRAVELYYYIKGGRVDYGAAHAAKYGHERYGRTYEGIMPDWAPGKKIHLIGHSMGGQTIRLMEEFLRNGNQEEIDYQRQNGGEISPLFLGGQDNMISSITTLGTPHNGSQAADKVANTDFVRNIMYALNRIAGNKDSTVDLGLTQWGFKQQPNESYIDYIERVSQSPIWNSTDNAAYDLTLEGSAKLNEQTSLNPNITYTTYTGAATHAGPLGNENPNIGLFPLMDLTSRIIGGDDLVEWRKNDGVVPVISSLHPLNQAFINIAADALATRKGIWQVRPILENWDHVDFIGIDATDLKRTGEELANFYMGIVNNLMQVESLDGKQLAS